MVVGIQEQQRTHFAKDGKRRPDGKVRTGTLVSICKSSLQGCLQLHIHVLLLKTPSHTSLLFLLYPVHLLTGKRKLYQKNRTILFFFTKKNKKCQQNNEVSSNIITIIVPLKNEFNNGFKKRVESLLKLEETITLPNHHQTIIIISV